MATPTAHGSSWARDQTHVSTVTQATAVKILTYYTTVGTLFFLFFFSFIYLFIYFCFRAPPTAYTSSQAKGQIGAAGAGLRHIGSKPHLQPIPQFMVMPDPRPTE